MNDSGYSIIYILIYFLFYAFLAALLTVWISVLICKCYRSSPRFRSAAAPTQSPTRPSGGLDVAAIEALPSFRFVGGGEGPSNCKSRSDCVVCLGIFEDNETLRLMPSCGHVFHSGCVDVWLRSHATCPYCRAAVAPPQEVRIVVAPPRTGEALW